MLGWIEMHLQATQPKQHEDNNGRDWCSHQHPMATELELHRLRANVPAPWLLLGVPPPLPQLLCFCYSPQRRFYRIAWMHCLVAPGKSVACLTQDGNGLQCSTDDANATATATATANAAASATGTTLFTHGLLHENTLLRSNARRH